MKKTLFSIALSALFILSFVFVACKRNEISPSNATITATGAAVRGGDKVGGKCEAEGVFNSCTVTCTGTLIPNCRTRFLGLTAKCTCDEATGSGGATKSATQSQNMEEFISLLSEMNSQEASTSLSHLENMKTALQNARIEVYHSEAELFNTSLYQLSIIEKASVNTWLESKGVTERL